MSRFSGRDDEARKTSKAGKALDTGSPRLRIESIREEASGTAIRAVGGFSFVVDRSQLEEYGLAASILVAGTELDEETEAILRLAAEALEAERRGLGLLARAEQSAAMLHDKLAVRGFAERAIRSAIERLKAQGFLDDRRFAAAYAASRLSRRSEGPRSLEAALRARGLDSETAKEAVAQAFGAEDRRKWLFKAIARERKRCGGDLDLLRERLRELGYRSEEVREALSQLDESGDTFT